MFSGKTEELLRRLRRARIANQEVVIFKPALDDRYATDRVVSHDANSLQALSVSNAAELASLAGSYDVIGVDEAQFVGRGGVHHEVACHLSAVWQFGDSFFSPFGK